MNTHHLRRALAVLAGLAAALLAFATPAFAVNYPLPANGGQPGQDGQRAAEVMGVHDGLPSARKSSSR